MQKYTKTSEHFSSADMKVISSGFCIVLAFSLVSDYSYWGKKGLPLLLAAEAVLMMNRLMFLQR